MTGQTMALDIPNSTVSPPSPASARAPASGELLLARALPARARRLVDPEDFGSYRELFDALAAIDDRHERHFALIRVLEDGLKAAASLAPARRSASLAALAGGVLDALERQPAEPRLLYLAGKVMYELRDVDAAAALLAAAKRLDPKLEGLDERLRELAERQAVPPGADERRGSLRAPLGDVSARAVEVAARARPAEGLTLSLCMIVRDEQEMLPRCLDAVAAAVDEIVVVDTGSTDATIEIARSFGARVIERAWTGSFAEARNASFDAARGDWLLYLDADEVLAREDAPLLRALTGHTWREAFYLSETNYTGELDGGTTVTHDALRIFRNRPQYRFEGRLHEQIAHRLPAYLPERIAATNIRVEHYGYLGVLRGARAKSRRNIELLRLEQAEVPNDPFVYYNLGSEYAADGDATAALAQFERAWELLEASGERDSYRFTPALISRTVKALRACARHRDAIARAQDGLDRHPDFTDLVLEQALAHGALGHDEQAIVLCERCIEMGPAPRRYTAAAGAGSYLPRVALAELRRRRGELSRAVELLERCLSEDPEFVGAVLPYASALLAQGLGARAVVRALEERLPRPSPAARFMLGTALSEAGASASAETQFRAVLARRPHCARARAALAETLLAQRRYGDAASEAAALADEDALAVIARRTELFARIAAGDWAGTTTALARAKTAGMAREEIDLFIGWQQLARSGHTTIALTAKLVPQLEVMLEALLRVAHFEAFEVLLGLLERSPLPQRERRELLAAMYLRRGFIASAAREWMAVCNETPDTRALLGLARVSAAAGMQREVHDFAVAALAKDPTNEEAKALLSKTAVESLAA
jgi:tetratricopeptide (TPR) repeat protein